MFEKGNKLGCNHNPRPRTTTKIQATLREMFKDSDKKKVYKRLLDIIEKGTNREATAATDIILKYTCPKPTIQIEQTISEVSPQDKAKMVHDIINEKLNIVEDIKSEEPPKE